MNELITVIVPVFNNEKYIKKCLDSICSSEYEQLEIIVVDDGSTDDSGGICDACSEKDSRIKVLHQKNSGVSRSRNYGIRYASGKYIAFIDSDDYVEEDYFLKLLEMQCEADADLSVGAVAHVYKESVEYSKIKARKIDLLEPSSEAKEAFYDLNQKFLLYGPCNKLYKTEIIAKNQIMFPEDTSYGEDLLFNFSYLKCCRSIVCGSQPCYFYNHENENSLSHRYQENLFENGLRLTETIYSFSEEKQLLSGKMQYFCARRIVDDAYNSLFDLWNDKCRLSTFRKYQRVKMIVNHKKVQEALALDEYKDYSKVYIRMMRKKQALRFFFIRSILSGLR